MKFKRPEVEQASIPLAPMIDVVFLLLIFFIVTWKFSRDEVDLNVSVPTADHGDSSQRPLGEIIVNVRDNGVITIDGQQYSEDDLKIRLQSIAEAYQDKETGKSRQPIRIRGAGQVEYERILDVVDLCKEAGIWNISFSARKTQ